MLNSTYKHTIPSWKWDHERGKSSAPLRALLSSLLDKGSYIFYFALGLENDVALPAFRAYPIKYFWYAWPGQLQYLAERQLSLPWFLHSLVLSSVQVLAIHRYKGCTPCSVRSFQSSEGSRGQGHPCVGEVWKAMSGEAHIPHCLPEPSTVPGTWWGLHICLMNEYVM